MMIISMTVVNRLGINIIDLIGCSLVGVRVWLLEGISVLGLFSI